MWKTLVLGTFNFLMSKKSKKHFLDVQETQERSRYKRINKHF